nr:MAG TPA: hypothetical protein [Caudoviricetes sp.]
MPRSVLHQHILHTYTMILRLPNYIFIVRPMISPVLLPLLCHKRYHLS